jgi:hypothetical protein
MSRYSYFEFSVAALTVLSIYLLLATERFEKRGSSLLLGVSLGLGILVKRTFPVFVVGALTVVAFQAGLPRKLWRLIRTRPRLRWRNLGLAVAGGLLLSALWYLPNRDSALALPAGSWLFPVWWLLATITLYLVLLPSSTVTNFSSCCALALSLASLWYLPHSDFVQRALRAGWGVDDPRGRTVALTNLATYTDYIENIVHGFSLFYTMLLLLAIILLLFSLIRRRQRLLPDRWWDWDWWAILASLAVAYVILSTSIYKEPRAITPILPFLAILLGGALLRLPWRRLGLILMAMAIAFGLVQFFVISYTETRALVDSTNFAKPLLGQPGLFAQGPYLEVPDSGLNDPGFYIAGDVLQHVESTRLEEGWDTVSLGILAGSSHVHVGMFAYDQLRCYPAIQLENPVQAHPDQPGYSTAFRYDYLLVLNEGNRGEEVRKAANLILTERLPLFGQAFDLEKTYPLPDGSEAYLFRRHSRPSRAYEGQALRDTAAFLHTEATRGDLVVVYPPDLLVGLLEHYWGAAQVSSVADLEALLEELASAPGQHSRVFLVADQDTTLDALLGELSGYSRLPAQDQQIGKLQVVALEKVTP